MKSSPSTSDHQAPRLYTIWSEMQECCRNPRHPLHAQYGGRGICIAPGWVAYSAFRQWALASGYHNGAYLLRLDRDAHFTPDNCAWTDAPEHADVGASTPRLLAAFDEEKTVEAWGRDRRCRVSISTLRKRMASGWELEPALTTPPRIVPTYTAFGETKTAMEWIRDSRCVVHMSTFRSRLMQGWDTEQALTTQTTETRLRQTPVYEAFGEKRSLTDWLSDPRCCATRASVKGRLTHGWDLERALTTPTGFDRDVHQITAFGECKPLRAWVDDPRCVVGMRGLLVRMQQGWRGEEALTIPRGHDDKRTIEAFGERRTLADWLKDPRCQVGSRTLRQRLRQGWEPERTLTASGNLIRQHEGTAFGETKSIMDWISDKRCCVSANVLRQRLRRGWSLEQSLTMPVTHSTKKNMLTAFGETKSLGAWVRDKRCIVAQATVVERLSRGWGLEETLTTPPLPYPHSQDLTAFGDTLSMSAWLRDPRCKVTRGTLKRRIAAGWTAQEALTVPPGSRRGRRITAFGVTQSLQAWAQDPRCHVSIATITLRLSMNWPAEEAISTPAYDRLPQLTAFGDTKPISAWVTDARCVVSRATLLERLRDGWPADRALATPPRRRHREHANDAAVLVGSGA